MTGRPITVASLQNLIKVARGDQEAQLLLKNARLVNVFSSEIIETNLAIEGGQIAALGREYIRGNEVIDLDGLYTAPGLIDAHLHIESTLLLPAELARVITACGTTCVIHDPHEIANVLGINGVKMMLDSSAGLCCDFFATAPSCVPATAMETTGGALKTAEINDLLESEQVIGLGEMMNYPGVISGDEEVLNKLIAARLSGKVIDGHAPLLGGPDLQAYLSTGISSDHECITADEAWEKLLYGMKIIIRHGSASSSLKELLPLVNAHTLDQFMIGSDDREAAELLEKGHLNDVLRSAVALGANPLMMIRIATLNAARHYRLHDRGALAPGYRADITVFRDLTDFQTELVIKDGQVAARGGRMLFEPVPYQLPGFALNTINIGRVIGEDDFTLRAKSDLLPAIGVIPGQISTDHLTVKVKKNDRGEIMADPDSGICKIAVIERHQASGRVAVALIKGLGLREGAIASSVAHDAHNIIVAGIEEKAMMAAVNELSRIGGGFVVSGKGGDIRATLSLPVAGLMSTESAEIVAGEMEYLLKEASELGTDLAQPFLTLAFMALPVIPELKLTDRGLFDVVKFSFV